MEYYENEKDLHELTQGDFRDIFYMKKSKIDENNQSTLLFVYKKRGNKKIYTGPLI